VTRWLVLGLSGIAFLAAAKAHGRQLRLERELAGYLHVTFGGKNPAWVEALWQRERIYFFGVLVLLVFASVVFNARVLRSLGTLDFVLVLHILLPVIGAFVGTGLFSAARTGTLGGAGWWLLTITLTTALLWLMGRRAA
jgi:hypothetical protein